MKNIWKASIVFGFGAVVALLIMVARNLFLETNIVAVMQILSDAFFVPGVVIVGFGLLVFASNGGVFDMLAYSFTFLISTLRRDVTKRKYKDFYEYRKAKQEKKSQYGYIIIGGAVHIAIAVIFLILFFNFQ